mgnify:FL=1
MNSQTSVQSNNFPIVGVGSSAGGLEAFIQLLGKMPVDTGMAFILVQHLDPTQASLAVDIISKSTQLQIQEVEDGMRVVPNQIYVIPPNHNMNILDGVLHLLPRASTAGPHLTIDFFFQSLALAAKSRAIGIVLSGTGADGTLGLKAIKAAGGISCAQEIESAK